MPGKQNIDIQTD
jgi:hypothetical protein